MGSFEIKDRVRVNGQPDKTHLVRLVINNLAVLESITPNAKGETGTIQLVPVKLLALVL